MHGLQMPALILAFITGTIVSALFGNLLELQKQEVARLGEPFVTPTNILRSLLFIVLAGPYFLVSEGIHIGTTDAALKLATVVFAGLWALASGILWLEFFVRLAQFL